MHALPHQHCPRAQKEPPGTIGLYTDHQSAIANIPTARIHCVISCDNSRDFAFRILQFREKFTQAVVVQSTEQRRCFAA
ncbi:unnamed protein product [Periconia digitata]|uniref:Uncharacterized protein n=1 Tax=Periconia digitata TaxID=1303443 RepID=A0A9W4UU45_9PLEO|nr:unnamed protein product [Periconia digitata]